MLRHSFRHPGESDQVFNLTEKSDLPVSFFKHIECFESLTFQGKTFKALVFKSIQYEARNFE